MAYKITDNTNNVKNGLRQKSSLFLRTFAEQVVVASTPKTPRKTGRLRADVLKQVLGLSGKIVWGKNYAGRQESTQFRNYTTPGTGPHFAEDAINKMVRETESIARKVGLK